MASVKFSGVKKSYGSTAVIHELNFEIEQGEFVALVGPSGCGKSTILRMIAGLESVSEGTVSIDGKIVNDIEPKDRGIAMVFQNYALYPHMTIQQNLEFGLKIAGLDKKERDLRIGEVAEVLGLQSLLERKPSQLSGGQKQRVAMGRAMVRRPKVMLFDEPLSNLDAQLRSKVRAEIALLHKNLGATMVYVTHDQIEAMTLADRMAVLNKGKIEQYAAPMEIFHNPKTQFIASFIGSPAMNLLPLSLFSGLNAPESAEVVGFRPDEAVINPPSNYITMGKGRVSLVEPFGNLAHIHCEFNHSPVILELRQEKLPALQSSVDVGISREKLYFFDRSGNKVI